MKQVWKYVITLEGTTLEIPIKSKILCVGEQHGQVCIWMEVDTEEKWKIFRQFHVYGTGHQIYDELGMCLTRNYIGTVQFDNGNLVLHVYEYINNNPAFIGKGEIE